MADPNTERELNRLYWESDASISEIADRLDISRRALYDGIRPHPAGRPCPECGAALGFRNRTALDNREAECPECGFAAPLDGAGDGLEPAPEQADAPDAGSDDGPASPDGRSRLRDPLARRRIPDPGSPVLGTLFLTGLAVGALATFLTRRR